MKSNWEEIVASILTEHIGALAFVVIDDAIFKTKSAPDSAGFQHEIVLRLAQELPETVNRAQIAAQIRNAIK
jgi:hypothetical protein